MNVFVVKMYIIIYNIHKQDKDSLLLSGYTSDGRADCCVVLMEDKVEHIVSALYVLLFSYFVLGQAGEVASAVQWTKARAK